MSDLTERERLLYEIGLDHQREHGMPASIRELQIIGGFASTGSVSLVAERLQRKGYATHEPYAARGWRMVDPVIDGLRAALRAVPGVSTASALNMATKGKALAMDDAELATALRRFAAKMGGDR